MNSQALVCSLLSIYPITSHQGEYWNECVLAIERSNIHERPKKKSNYRRWYKVLVYSQWLEEMDEDEEEAKGG